jgi:hypothetical protein
MNVINVFYKIDVGPGCGKILRNLILFIFGFSIVFHILYLKTVSVNWKVRVAAQLASILIRPWSNKTCVTLKFKQKYVVPEF